MMMMGKEAIDNNELTLLTIDDNDLNDAYGKYFKAFNKGYYKIWSIGGGGGGSGDPFGSTSQYGRHGDHGDFGEYGAWIDRDTIVFDGSFNWFYRGSGGVDGVGTAGADGGQSRIVVNTGFLALRSGGDGGSSSPSTNPDVTDAGDSPFYTDAIAAGSVSSGKGGDGARWGGGRVADNGSSGQIIVKRLL